VDFAVSALVNTEVLNLAHLTLAVAYVHFAHRRSWSDACEEDVLEVFKATTARLERIHAIIYSWVSGSAAQRPVDKGVTCCGQTLLLWLP